MMGHVVRGGAPRFIREVDPSPASSQPALLPGAGTLVEGPVSSPALSLSEPWAWTPTLSGTAPQGISPPSPHSLVTVSLLSRGYTHWLGVLELRVKGQRAWDRHPLRSPGLPT